MYSGFIPPWTFCILDNVFLLLHMAGGLVSWGLMSNTVHCQEDQIQAKAAKVFLNQKACEGVGGA